MLNRGRRSRCKDCKEREPERILSSCQDLALASFLIAGTARAGDITIQAKTINLTEGAVIQAGTLNTTAAGGDATIAADSVGISKREPHFQPSEPIRCRQGHHYSEHVNPGKWFYRDQQCQ